MGHATILVVREGGSGESAWGVMGWSLRVVRSSVGSSVGRDGGSSRGVSGLSSCYSSSAEDGGFNGGLDYP